MYSRVYVEITNVCNMSCSFCHGHSRTPQRMTEDQFSQLLEKLEGQTKYIYYHLMGEPLTHPELCELIEIASEYGLRSAITTNGALLPLRGDELIASGVYKVIYDYSKIVYVNYNPSVVEVDGVMIPAKDFIVI